MLMFSLEDAIKLLDTNQAKLSALSDVRPNTIADLIKGSSKRIEVDTLENLLDALNGLARSKGIKKYFRVQDIIQYYNDDYADNEDSYGNIVIKQEFEMLRGILSKIYIPTEVPGLKAPTLTQLLILHHDTLTNGFLTQAPIVLTSTQKMLVSLHSYLTTYSLTHYKSEPFVTKFELTEKGVEFVKLLRKFGTE